MADLVDCLIENCAAVDKFCLLANSSSSVPNLTKKKYMDYKIKTEEWMTIKLIAQVLALTLNPTIKLEYSKSKWTAQHYKAGWKFFEKAFDMYQKKTASTTVLQHEAQQATAPLSPVKRHGYGASWLEEAIQTCVQDEFTTHDPRQEFKDYLKAPLEQNVDDPVCWWG
ncbi:hypothetical protein C0991_004274, partial [Blastosporella zonata]